jgi:hypothetical protein
MLSWQSTQATFIDILTINTGHLYRYPDNQHRKKLLLSWQSTQAIFIIILTSHTDNLYRYPENQHRSSLSQYFKSTAQLQTTTPLPVLISPLPVCIRYPTLPVLSVADQISLLRHQWILRQDPLRRLLETLLYKAPVLRIHDILVLIRIRGSMLLTNWTRILLFSSLTFKTSFCLLPVLFEGHFLKKKKSKRSHKTVEIKVFLTIFA